MNLSLIPTGGVWIGTFGTIYGLHSCPPFTSHTTDTATQNTMLTPTKMHAVAVLASTDEHKGEAIINPHFYIRVPCHYLEEWGSLRKCVTEVVILI